MLGDRIKNVHISDTGFAIFEHNRLGTGIVDFKSVGAALREIGYKENTVLEIIADALQPDTDPDGDFRASHALLADAGWEPLSNSASPN